MVAERRALLPPSGASGMAQVVLRLGENVLPLGEVLLTAVAQQFEPPPIQRPVDAQFSNLARLVGYEVAVPAAYASQPLPLTLVWQATADGGATSYTVFVHLVAPDGRIIAQHDGLPAGGSRPTTGWVAGEYVVDVHDLVFRYPDYSGPAKFVVGLYDAQTGVRLPLAGGGESFTLPSGVEILP